MGISIGHPDARHISSGFKLPNRADHVGIDIQIHNPNHTLGQLGLIYGVPVYASHDGIVLVAQSNNASAGNWVVIRSTARDPNSPFYPEANSYIVSRYLHLSGPPLVGLGPITQGTRIGYVGNSGFTRGSGPLVNPNNPHGARLSSGHLHLDFNHRNITGNTAAILPFAINPQRFFPNVTFTGQTNYVD